MEGRHFGIVGGGIAGLAAADFLSQEGCQVTVFEARARPGGRIHTVRSLFSRQPIELGAEFIHGDRNETWNTAEFCPHFEPVEFPDRHWEWRDGRLIYNRRFWGELSRVTEGFQEEERDISFAAFLRKRKSLPRHAVAMASDYVSGFHAADLSAVGVVSLLEADESAGATHGQRQFRLQGGSSLLVDDLMERLRQREVAFHFGSAVERVRWRKGRAEVFVASEQMGTIVVTVEKLLVTVPIGVLQARFHQPGAIQFEPELGKHGEMIDQLKMGAVIKLTLVFSGRFWPEDVFGFIHAHGKTFPVWWMGAGESVLVGWIGGTKADHLLREARERLVARALSELSAIFGIRKLRVQAMLLGIFVHDWKRDPFARGAYSYLPVGTSRFPERISEPIQQTLYFAGEALAPPGEEGTVHGAIASGKRAAQRILDAA